MRIKKSVCIVLASALGVAATSSFAQGPLSAEFLVGRAEQTIDVEGSGSADDLSIAVRGAYRVNAGLALEAAYQNYGEADDTYIDEFGDTINNKSSTSALNMGVKGILPFDNGFSIIGRAGLSFWNYELEHRDSAFPDEVLDLDDDGNGIYYGVGVEYSINENLFVGAEYSVMEAVLSLTDVAVDLEIENLSVSVGARF